MILFLAGGVIFVTIWELFKRIQALSKHPFVDTCKIQGCGFKVSASDIKTLDRSMIAHRQVHIDGNL